MRIAELLRASSEQRGLITANGGYITKHAFGVYSRQRPSTPFRHDDLQARVAVMDKDPELQGVNFLVWFSQSREIKRTLRDLMFTGIFERGAIDGPLTVGFVRMVGFMSA